MRHLFLLLKKDTEGATAVEFALIAPLLFILIFGLVEFGRLYWLQGSMAYAVEGAGRYAMLNISASNTDVINIAKTNLYGIDPTSVNFTVSGSNSGGVNYLTIVAQSSFNFIPDNLLSYGTINLSKQVRVPLLP